MKQVTRGLPTLTLHSDLHKIQHLPKAVFSGKDRFIIRPPIKTCLMTIDLVHPVSQPSSHYRPASLCPPVEDNYIIQRKKKRRKKKKKRKILADKI
jgi:hypothetical protein